MIARLTAALLLAAALTALPASAQAGGFTITILGGRRTGMMTNVAAPDDLTAVLHNPAGLADQPGVRTHLSFGMSLMHTRVQMQALDPKLFPEINPEGCGEPGADPCPWPIGADGYYVDEIGPERYFGLLPFGGVSTDLGFISPRLRKLVVALGVYTPNFYGAFLPQEAPTAYHVTEAFFLVLAVNASAAYRINDKLAVGAGLAYHYLNISFGQKYSTTDLLTKMGGLPETMIASIQSSVGDLLLDYTGVDHGLGWNVGLLFTPTRWLALGLSYNGATAARLEGDLGLTPTGPNPDALPMMLKLQKVAMPDGLVVEMPIPHALHVGLNLMPARWIEIGVDYRLWFYNMMQRQEMIPRYSNIPAGYSEAITQQDMSKDKNYSVSWEIAAGVLVRPLRAHQGLELMAGVSFDKSPVPDESWSLDNPSLDQLVVSAGARWQVTDHWRVAATYMIDFYLRRDVKTSKTWPPSNGRGESIGQYPGLEAEYIF